MEKEDGEMSDDYAMIVDDDSVPAPAKDTENITVLFKAEKNGLTIEKLEKIDAAKIEERAKRFGLNLTGLRVVTQTQIDELYAKSGIESGNERHFRFDTLHLCGIDGLTTREIFEYLEDYQPVSLERVDDTSCNVVCQDHIATALALLVHSREIRDEELKKMLSEKSNHHWREGMPHPKNDLILMRFGTNSDKKVGKSKVQLNPLEEPYDRSMGPISKNPWGDLCRSWGVYDHQEVFQPRLPQDYEDDIEEIRVPPKIRNRKLAMRLGKKRRQPQEFEESSDSDIEWKKKSKTPRMRMRADDEESKIKLARPIKEEHSDDDYDDERPRARSRDADRDVFAPLSVEVVNSKSNYIPRESTKLSDKFKFHNSNTTVPSDRSQIRARLGVKVVKSTVEIANVISELEESLSSDEYFDDYNTMSRVQRVSKTKPSSTVWSRLETQKGDNDNREDLRQILATKKPRNTDDLRERIGKCKRANIRIEIDNK